MTTKKKDSVQLWVEALESGEYKQGKGKLVKLMTSERRYCCLGVACDLYIKEYPRSRFASEFRRFGTLQREGEVCAPIVQKWLGLRTNRGVYNGGSLARLNDVGNKPFSYIAKRIRDRPRGLFKDA